MLYKKQENQRVMEQIPLFITPTRLGLISHLFTNFSVPCVGGSNPPLDKSTVLITRNEFEKNDYAGIPMLPFGFTALLLGIR